MTECRHARRTFVGFGERGEPLYLCERLTCARFVGAPPTYCATCITREPHARGCAHCIGGIVVCTECRNPAVSDSPYCELCLAAIDGAYAA